MTDANLYTFKERYVYAVLRYYIKNVLLKKQRMQYTGNYL